MTFIGKNTVECLNTSAAIQASLLDKGYTQ